MDKLKQWVALTVVAVIAVLGAGWVLLITPRHSDATTLRADAAEQERGNAQLRSQLSVLKAQAVDLPAEQAKLATLATQLPALADQPDVLRSLVTAADTAGVELGSVAPALATPVVASASATSTTSTAATSSGAGTAGELMALPVNIVVAGGYFQIEQFLSALETMPRATRVTAVALVPGASPTALPGPTVSLESGANLLATITANVYVASGAAPLTPVVAPAATTTK